MTQLIESLDYWNGKQVLYLKQIYQNHLGKTSFIPYLLSLLSTHTTLQKAITWLIKYHIEQKNILSTIETKQLVEACLLLENWEAQLHVLQILPYLELNDELIETLEIFIGKQLDSPKKFVKAWAYNGLYELTRYQPKRKADTVILLEAALEVESAAVKARVRNLIKKLEPQ